MEGATVPRFYLHVRRGRDYALDREGYEFPNVEVARNEVLRAALKAWRRLPEGQDPSAYAMEVEHESGVMVLSVPFADALTIDTAAGIAGLRLHRSHSSS
jgi:hypothetical protein